MEAITITLSSAHRLIYPIAGYSTMNISPLLVG